MGWDPETDNFCLHNDDDLGIALVTEGITNYVQPICENCSTLLGTKACLWRLVTRAAAERHETRLLEVEDIIEDELLIMADEEDEEEGFCAPEEDNE
jgi:hypothetical protein